MTPASHSSGRSDGSSDLPLELERFDLEKFGAALRAHRDSRRLSLRRAAEAANVSFSTLARVEAGSQPDLASFTALCAWMGAPPSQFFVPVAERARESIDDIVGHLRQDPNLSAEASASIGILLREMYAKLAIRVEPGRLVACHLRAASVLRPGVPDRLSSLLVDMHRSLEAKVAAGEL
ncbi:MAG: helix-turn-helix domain-containing protein [Propionibacteriaceae bacterium]